MPISLMMHNTDPFEYVRHIGDRLEHVPGVRRRSVLVAGTAGALAAFGAALPGRLAGANPAAPAAALSSAPPSRPPASAGDAARSLHPAQAKIPADVLPFPERAPRPGEKARAPYTSGGIGNWSRSNGVNSAVGQDRAVAASSSGLFVLGDSVGTRLLPALRKNAPERQFAWNLWNGRPTAPAIEALRSASADKRLPRDILLVLGSNDVFDPHRFAKDAEALVKAAKGHRLFWVTPYVGRAGSHVADLRNTAILGLALERLSAAHADVHLVPWFEFIARKPSTHLAAYLEDGVHPSPAGALALAELTQRVLRQM